MISRSARGDTKTKAKKHWFSQFSFSIYTYMYCTVYSMLRMQNSCSCPQQCVHNYTSRGPFHIYPPRTPILPLKGLKVSCDLAKIKKHDMMDLSPCEGQFWPLERSRGGAVIGRENSSERLPIPKQESACTCIFKKDLELKTIPCKSIGDLKSCAEIPMVNRTSKALRLYLTFYCEQRVSAKLFFCLFTD